MKKLLIVTLSLLMVFSSMPLAGGESSFLAPPGSTKLLRMSIKCPKPSANRLISQAISDLHSNEAEKIVEALKFLSAMHITECAEHIKSFLNHKTGKIRKEAIKSLGKLGDLDFLDELESSLRGANNADDEEMRLLAGALFEIDNLEGIKRILKIYQKVDRKIQKQIYYVLTTIKIKPQYIEPLRKCIEEIGYEKPSSAILYLILGESGLKEAKKVMLNINKIIKDENIKNIASLVLVELGDADAYEHTLKIFVSTPAEFKQFLYIAIRILGKILLNEPEFYAKYIQYFRSHFERSKNPLEKMEAAIILGQRGERNVIPYLNEQIKNRHMLRNTMPEYLVEISDILLSFEDPRSIPVFSDIACNVSGNENTLERNKAMKFLSLVGRAKAGRVLMGLFKDEDVNIYELAASLYYEMLAKEKNILTRKMTDVKDKMPGIVWVPIKISNEDIKRKDYINELLKMGILKTWDNMIEEEPLWKDWFHSVNMSKDEIYFAPIRDPSYILISETGEIIRGDSGRAILIPAGRSDYILKYAGGTVPVVRGNLTISYYFEPDLWFYGSRSQSWPSREIDNHLAVQRNLENAFRTNPTLKAVQSLFGVQEDLFLKFMIRIEPLFIPVGIQKEYSSEDQIKLGEVYFHKQGTNVAFVPISEGLQLANVPIKKRDDINLQMFIYKNLTGVNTRLSKLLFSNLKYENWKPLFSKLGYKMIVNEEGVKFYKDNQPVSNDLAFDDMLLVTAVRFAAFLLYIHDYLNMSCDEKLGDIFTYQNINPLVISDYETFSKEGYVDEYMRRQIIGSVLIINQIGEYFGLSSSRIRKAHQLFRETLTGEIVNNIDKWIKKPEAKHKSTIRNLSGIDTSN